MMNTRCMFIRCSQGKQKSKPSVNYEPGFIRAKVCDVDEATSAASDWWEGAATSRGCNRSTSNRISVGARAFVIRQYARYHIFYHTNVCTETNTRIEKKLFVKKLKATLVLNTYPSLAGIRMTGQGGAPCGDIGKNPKRFEARSCSKKVEIQNCHAPMLESTLFRFSHILQQISRRQAAEQVGRKAVKSFRRKYLKIKVDKNFYQHPKFNFESGCTFLTKLSKWQHETHCKINKKQQGILLDRCNAFARRDPLSNL
jgi:hypothetical protein